MKRAIVDYKKLTKDILALLVEKYPEGYQDHDVIRFKNAKNETVEALEVRTEDTIYLVKVSTRLASTMERYDEDEDDYYGEGIQADTLEMSREDELALRKKKDISKTSSHLDDDDDEEEDDEEDDYKDDYDEEDEEDQDDEDDNEEEDDEEEDDDEDD
nr:DNA primase [uncultured Capnocytophaga sp.]